MKKIHILGVAVLGMFAVGVVGVVSASAAEWLAEGKAIATASATTEVGEFTLGSTNGLKLAIKSAVLCSFDFVGTVGPGAADTVVEVLSLAGVTVTLATPLTCTEVETCTMSEVAPVDLPWRSTLTSATVDVLTANGKGNPGWELVCKMALGTIEETCTFVSRSFTVENDVAEKDMLGKFTRELTGTCTIGGTNTGFWESTTADGAFLISLITAETLASS